MLDRALNGLDLFFIAIFLYFVFRKKKKGGDLHGRFDRSSLRATHTRPTPEYNGENNIKRHSYRFRNFNAFRRYYSRFSFKVI